MKLSEHFTLEELTFSQTAIRLGINNTPTEDGIIKLGYLCNTLLEPLREAIGTPIRISSGYRSPELNKAIGGAATSRHCLYEAVDMTVPGWTVEQFYQFIKHSSLPYRQLIQEFDSWVHLSVNTRNNKGYENLRAVKENGKTVYMKD
jgi:hypothetical protein